MKCAPPPPATSELTWGAAYYGDHLALMRHRSELVCSTTANHNPYAITEVVNGRVKVLSKPWEDGRMETRTAFGEPKADLIAVQYLERLRSQIYYDAC